MLKPKKMIVLVAVATAILLIIKPSFIYTNGAFAPGGYTGAPNEPTCNTASCHVSNSVITDQTKLTLKTPSAPYLNSTTGYVPGSTYNLSVSLSSGTPKYGFSITALDQFDHQAGVFLPGNGTNANATHIDSVGDRQYVSHNNANSTNGWLFKWKAPATDIGPVSFYLTGCGANNDNLATGDKVYFNKYVVTTSSLLLGVDEISNMDNNPQMQVYPNPVVEKFKIEYFIENSEPVKMDIYSTDGRLVRELYSGTESHGDHFKDFELEAGLQGLHLLRVTIGNNVYYKKLMVNN